MDAKAQRAQGRGPAVIGFGAGEPDFPTPDYIVEAAQRACAEPRFHKYSPAAGLPELREAIAAKTERDSGYQVARGQVLVTNGGKQAVYQAFATLLDPGDEVLLPDAVLDHLPGVDRLAGGTPVTVMTDENPATWPRSRDLEARRTDRTKVAAVRVAVQPDRRGYPPELVAEIGRWAAEHGLWVITDEIYEHLVYGDARFPRSPVAAPEIADRCVVLNGVAKTYAMTGWRVGWMIGPPDVTKAAADLQSHPTSNVCNVAQAAALAAVSGDLSAVARMREAFDRRRQTHDRHAERDSRRGLPAARGRVLLLSVGQGRARQGVAGRRPASTPSSPSSCSTRPTSRSCPARRSARPATSGCRARSATPTWRKGSPGSASCSAQARRTSRQPGRRRHGTPARRTPQGAPAPALHRRDAACHPGRPARRTECTCRGAGRGLAAAAGAADERGWFRFQRLYDIARSVVRTEADVRRLIREAAQDEREEGSGWLEIQVDPSGYAARLGGLTPTVELVLDAAAAATAATGVGIGVIIAANRTRHPLDARTLARLAAAHAGRGVTGFACPTTSAGGPRRLRPGLPDRRRAG